VIVSRSVASVLFVIGIAMLDCIIVGGGPAGLSTALVLGRCRRQVLVCDAGEQRNACAREIHGYLTRDCTPPHDFLSAARADLASYPNVTLREVKVTEASCAKNDTFQIVTESGDRFSGRTLVLATGVVDQLPELAGLDALYGKSVVHCPYCDGWEWRDRAIAVYGKGASGAGLAAKLRLWSHDLVLCTDGPHELTEEQLHALRGIGVRMISEKIDRLEGDSGQLRSIRFVDGARLECDAMFVITRQVQASALAAHLGCEDRERRTVPTGEHQKTHLPGLYVVGDASRDVQMVIIAAAEGADAAFSINKYLLAQELPTVLL
jgi:thioredoxin reductase